MSNNEEVSLLPYQKIFLTSTAKTTVLLAGRGSGKTTAAVYLIAIYLCNGYSGIVTAQTYRMLKLNILKEVASFLKRIRASFKLNQTDHVITMSNGAVLIGLSAEDSQVDQVRGLSNLKFLVMDEAALALKSFFITVIACLRGKGISLPRIYLLTTPKGGRNWVSEIVKSHDCFLVKATTYDNTFLSDDYVPTLKSFYSDSFVQQEIYAQINEEDSTDQVLPTKLLLEAYDRYPEPAFDRSKRIIGIDAARYGDDEITIYFRDAYKVTKFCSLSGKDKESFNVFDKIRKLSPDPDKCIINIDGTGGFASGIVDIARKSKYEVNELNFGAASPDAHYANLRTYLYFHFKDCLPKLGMKKDDKLEEELLATKYVINHKNQIALIPKDEIKKVLQHSPDDADGCVLTCYSPLIVPIGNKESASSSIDQIMNTEY